MEDKKDILKRLGLKTTPQRLAILDVLEGNTSHPSAEEIYEQLKDNFPSLSLTTVYNTLELLANRGEIQEIGIDTECRRFDPNPTPHYHFQCVSCRRVYDLELSLPLNGVEREVEGFEIHSIHVYSYGVCPECRKS